jgi:hypothetical protein
MGSLRCCRLKLNKMNKKLLYGIGIGAVALFLYLNRKKLAALKSEPAKPASAPANKPTTAPANKPAPVTTAPVTEPIFVDDRGLPTWEDALVTPSTTPPVPLDRNLFEIPFSPTDILPKGLEYNYDY